MPSERLPLMENKRTPKSFTISMVRPFVAAAFFVSGCDKGEVEIDQRDFEMGLSENDVAERLGEKIFLFPVAFERLAGDPESDSGVEVYYISNRIFYKFSDRDRVMYFGFNKGRSLVMIDVRDELRGKFSDEEIERIREMEMERYRRQ